MANFVSFSNVPGNTDCSWYQSCDFHNLCEDCSKCGIGCPKYYPYQSEVLRGGSDVPTDKSDVVFALPYAIHSTGSRGVLIVSKTVNPLNVTIHGLGSKATMSQVLDGSVDGETQ